VKPLPLRTTLSLAYTAVLAVVLTALAFGYHSMVVQQLDAAATLSLQEKTRGLHGYLRFDSGSPVLSYDTSDPEEAAFIGDVSRYYQVYDATSGRLLTQSPGMESLGLRYTPAEIAELRARSEPDDVDTDRGRLRVFSTVIPAAAGQQYLVQVGELLDGVDRAVAQTETLLFWRSLAGLLVAVLLGWWLAGLALSPLARLASATRTIGIGRLHDRLPVRGAGDELDQVADAFNQALGRVEKSVGEMRQFSAALAHELRTPIAILRGEAELELTRPLSGEARQERLISQVEEYDRLTRLINQILTLARAEAGEIQLSRAPVALGSVAAAVTEQIEPVASARRITLTCEAESAVTVVGDTGWLERLLLILLDNAIKYTADDGGVRVRVLRDGDAALLTVEDSGVGIAPEALPHLFDRFYRADGGAARHASGAGLGLALAKWIVEHHRGTIEVSSTPGAGSTFAVRLPASHGPAAGGPVESPETSRELPPEH
jgi:heavy metal sensor kinase